MERKPPSPAAAIVFHTICMGAGLALLILPDRSGWSYFAALLLFGRGALVLGHQLGKLP